MPKNSPDESALVAIGCGSSAHDAIVLSFNTAQ
jgi:hypothetical protein